MSLRQLHVYLPSVGPDLVVEGEVSLAMAATRVQYRPHVR